MTKERQSIGIRGENLAASYLEGKGYRILERRYQCGRKEIDLIAGDQRTLVFVEVKSRSSRDEIPPFLAVNTRKQARILKVARAYLATHPLPEGMDVRFDVISVIVSPDNPPRIDHIVDAFRAV